MEWTTTVNKFVLLFQTIEKECAEQYLGLKCAKMHPWQESSVLFFTCNMYKYSPQKILSFAYMCLELAQPCI